MINLGFMGRVKSSQARRNFHFESSKNTLIYKGQTRLVKTRVELLRYTK